MKIKFIREILFVLFMSYPSLDAPQTKCHNSNLEIELTNDPIAFSKHYNDALSAQTNAQRDLKIKISTFKRLKIAGKIFRRLFACLPIPLRNPVEKNRFVIC